MDAHDLHGALCGSARLAFPRAAVAQLGHVGQKLANAHQAAGVHVGHQLGDVGHGPRLTGSHQRSPVARGIQEGFEQIGDRHPAGLGVELADEGCGARGTTTVLSHQRSTGRGDPLGSQRVPERGRSLRTVARLAQPDQRRIGEG